MIPYQKLYIYEIDGRVTREDNDFPTDYIGTWWEGEHSFLAVGGISHPCRSGCRRIPGICETILKGVLKQPSFL